MSDWKSKRLFKGNKLVANSAFNAALYIDNLYPDLFGYDANNEQIYVINSPPWHSQALFAPHLCEDSDIIHMRLELEQYGLRISYPNLRKVIKVNAEKTPFKPTTESRKRLYETVYAAPPGWYDIIKDELAFQTYAFPKDLLYKILPDKTQHTAKNKRRVTGVLRKLGFQSVVENVKGTRRSTRRWKKVM